MKTTRVETNNVPGLTSAVRGQEGRGKTYKTINSLMRERFLLDPTPAGRNALPEMGGFPKRASTALVRAMRKGLLSVESINRAAQAMKPGTARAVRSLGRGQFNVADLMVGNIGGKGQMAVRKLPSFNYARLKDAYTPIQADIRQLNKAFPQSTGNPLFAEYLNIGRKGAFQRVASQPTDLKNVFGNNYTDEGAKLLDNIERKLWDIRAGNTGPEGQIFDYISRGSPGVGTVPYKTTRLFNVVDDLKPTRFVSHPEPVFATPRKALDVKPGPNHIPGYTHHWADDYLAAARTPARIRSPEKLREVADVRRANAQLNNLIRKHWLGGGVKTGADYPDWVDQKLGASTSFAAGKPGASFSKEAFAPALRAAMGLGRIGLKGLKYGVRGYREAFPHVPIAGGARALKWTSSPASAAGPSWWKRFLRLNKPDTRYLTSPGTRPLDLRKPPSLGGFSKGATEKHAELYKESLVPVITGALGALGTGLYRGVTGESQGLGKDMTQGFWDWSGGSLIPTNLISGDAGDAKTGWLPSMWGKRGHFGSQFGMSDAQRGAYEKMTPAQQKQYATTFMDGKSKKWEQHPAARTNKPGWFDRFFGSGMGSAVFPPAAVAGITPYYAAGGGAYKNSISPSFAQFEGTQSYGKGRSWADKVKTQFNVQDNLLGTWRQNVLMQRPPASRAPQHPGVDPHRAAPGGYKAQSWQSADKTQRWNPQQEPMYKGGADSRWRQHLSRMLADERARVRENTGQWSGHLTKQPPAWLMPLLGPPSTYEKSLNAPATADMRAPSGVGSKYSPANPIQAHMGPAELKAHNLSNDNAPPMKKGGADEGSSGFLATLLRNLRDVSLVGAGGVSAGTAGDFLRRQLKYIKQYNPTIVSASPDRFAPKSVLRHVLPKLREGDVLVHGDMPIDVKEVARQKHLLKLRKELNRQLRAAGGTPKPTPMSAIKLNAQKLVRAITDMGSGGMGGFDEHAKIFTRPKRHGIQSYGPLRSVTPTVIPDNPKGRRTPWVPAAERARKNVATRKGRRQLFRDPVEAVKRVYGRYRLAQAQARKPVTQPQLNKLLSDTVAGSDELLDLASKKEPMPFSIMRPKEYSQQKAHKYMRQVANTTVDNADTWQAAVQRRLMPRWASDLIEKVRTKIRPGASQQGTNCAGGVCKAILGKGTYNLPSDFRQMKEFETVMDVMPENALKRMGGTPKNLEPVRKIMRRGAFRGSLPGLLGGLGLMGLGTYGAMKRSSDRWFMDDGSIPPGDVFVHPSWFPVVRKRFGPPHQSKLINNIVRAKSVGRYNHKGQIPAASQKKAPKPQPKRFEGYTTDPYAIGGKLGVQKLPSISSYISPKSPKLDHLFKKDGTPIDAWSAQRKMIN